MIGWLWVQGDYGHNGLGNRFVEAAEHEAARRGCAVVRVNTPHLPDPGLLRRSWPLAGR
jgi:predicted N-acetyltransferase YhbS